MVRVEVFSKDGISKIDEFQASVVTVEDGVVVLQCVGEGGLVSKTIPKQNEYRIYFTRL